MRANKIMRRTARAAIMAWTAAAFVGCGGEIATTSHSTTNGKAQIGRGETVEFCTCDCGDAACPPNIPPGSEEDAAGYSCSEQCAIWGIAGSRPPSRDPEP
jgi:hypothetical protein